MTMQSDDTRHGTTRGFHAGCRNHCCRTAIARYEKATKYRRHSGITWAIPATGTQRRIQALMALGWTTTDIAQAAGYMHRNALFRILHGQKGKPCRWVERKTYRTIAETYERLSMTIPEHAPHRARTRSLAQKKGYLPPLAWTDIDDELEQPADWRYVPSDRETAIHELASQGENPTQIARRLGLNHRALERWCLRHTPDIWRQLVAREGDWNSTGNLSHQTMRGGAA